MSIRLVSLCFLILVSSESFAGVKITGINANTYSAASGKFFGLTTSTVTNIYGGFSGTECSAAGTVCDSCAVSPTTSACNARRIYDNLDFQVTFQYTSTETIPRLVLVTTDFEDGNQTQLTQTTNLGNVTAGSHTVSVKWSEICNRLSGGLGGCNVSINSKSLRIGVDTDGNGNLSGDEYTNELRFNLSSMTNGSTAFCKTADATVTGACNFNVYPGDKKVYIETVRANCSFPSIDSATITALRVFYKQESLGGVVDQTAPHTDLALSSTKQAAVGNACILGLAKNEVTGLENSTAYLFAIGVVDIAGNVGYVTQYTAPDDVANCYDVTGAETLGNLCHQATPSEVNGLSTDEFDCFITTATYGSPFKPKVQTFRKFRNQFLKTNFFGRKIIKTYYNISPPIADWIRQHPQSKSYVRAILWPLWFFAKVCLEYPLAFLLLLFSYLVFKRKTLREFI